MLIVCVVFTSCEQVQNVIKPEVINQTQSTAEETFNQELQPILTERCALSGCHVANGPHDIDLRTYQTFLAGGDEGSIFVPGNAEQSEIIEEIVSGNMPLGGPPLTAEQIQRFKDWINQQDPADFPELHYDEHGDHDPELHYDEHGDHDHADD